MALRYPSHPTLVVAWAVVLEVTSLAAVAALAAVVALVAVAGISSMHDSCITLNNQQHRVI